MFRSFSRRNLFAEAMVATPLARWLDTFLPTPEVTKVSRTQATFELRKLAALVQSKRPIASMVSNGDENNLPNRIACFTKGLPQNQFGEVESGAYDALLVAVKSGKHAPYRMNHRQRVNGPRKGQRTQVHEILCLHCTAGNEPA